MQVFVNSGNLFPGGFAGLSLLVTRSLSKFANIELSFSVVYILLNIFPTLLVYKYIGHRFTIFSIIQILLVSLFTFILPRYQLTSDPLLIAVFGGLLSGLGISIALRHGASSGGTDFLAIYFANKLKRPTWNYVFVASAVVILFAGFLFGWNAALYSIIYQFCNTQMVSLRHDRYKLANLIIVTRKADEVEAKLLGTVRHGITILSAEGGYAHRPEKVLLMTVNAFQVEDLVEAAKKADPHVFINISHTERIVGNYYQAPLE
jgi:uncharacterized membrane-anchored protein YitT (DUF2179 family)